MITNALARKALLAQHALLRTPLSMLDRRLAARAVADDSTVRVTLGRSLGTLDKALARLLSEPVEPAAAKPTAAKPRAEASTAKTSAEDEPRPDEPSSATDTPSPADRPSDTGPLPEEEVARVATELRSELDEAPLAGELADADENEKQRMADLRAKHIVEEYEEQQRARKAHDAQES